MNTIKYKYVASGNESVTELSEDFVQFLTQFIRAIRVIRGQTPNGK